MGYCAHAGMVDVRLSPLDGEVLTEQALQHLADACRDAIGGIDGGARALPADGATRPTVKRGSRSACGRPRGPVAPTAAGKGATAAGKLNPLWRG